MKLFLAILFLFNLNLAQAKTKMGWICVGTNDQSAAQLRKLNLDPDIYLEEVGLLILDQSTYCKSPYIMIYRGFCSFDRYSLAIGLGDISLLTTQEGKKIELFCQEDEVVGTQGVIGGSN